MARVPLRFKTEICKQWRICVKYKRDLNTQSWEKIHTHTHTLPYIVRWTVEAKAIVCILHGNRIVHHILEYKCLFSSLKWDKDICSAKENLLWLHINLMNYILHDRKSHRTLTHTLTFTACDSIVVAIRMEVNERTRRPAKSQEMRWDERCDCLCAMHAYNAINENLFYYRLD